MARYTYGDSALAAERLRLVAATFGPASRAFVRAMVTERPSLAVDLGCGPGDSTAMVHEASGAARTVGLDASAEHVARAGERWGPPLAFAVHDVTSTPFPTGAADLVYARLVLAHLADPGAVVRSWCTQIAPNGVVLLDDLETIDVEDGVVRDYLEEVALAVVRRAGGALFVGPALHAMPDPAGALRIHDDVATVAPSPSVTARIFGMNLQVLVARGEVPARPEVAEGLAAIADGTRASGPVTWRMRQVAFRIG